MGGFICVSISGVGSKRQLANNGPDNLELIPTSPGSRSDRHLRPALVPTVDRVCCIITNGEVWWHHDAGLMRVHGMPEVES